MNPVGEQIAPATASLNGTHPNRAAVPSEIASLSRPFPHRELIPITRTIPSLSAVSLDARIGGQY
jgi:hypothetical protein